MKRILTSLTLSIIILTGFNASAQIKSYVGIYGGISSPTGNYASTDYNNNESAYAKRGVTFALDGAVYVYKGLAIGGTISFQDQGKLNANDTYNLAQGYNHSFGADQVTVSGYDRFHNWNLLVGPQYSFAYHKFILDLRVSAGGVRVSSTPETSVVVTGVPEQTSVIYQRKASAFLFGYGASGGLRYKLSDNLSLGIRASYITSDGPSITTEGRTQNVGRLVTKLPMTEWQGTIGLAMSFGGNK